MDLKSNLSPIWCLLAMVVLPSTISGQLSTPAAGRTTIPAIAEGLTINSTVSAVIPGITDHAIITCSFSRSSSPQIASLTSLILSRWNAATESYQELTAITSLRPDDVTVQQNVADKIDGHLDQNGESFLSLEWDYPSKNVATTYVCSSNAFDSMGHPIISSVGLEVRLKAADFSTLAEALRVLREQQKNQRQRLDAQHELDTNLTYIMEKQQNANTAQENAIQRLTNELNDQDLLDKNMTKALEKARSANVAQDKSINDLTVGLKEQQSIARNLSRDVTGQKAIVNELSDSLLRVHDKRCMTSNVTIDRKLLYWCYWPVTFEQAKIECVATGGKLAEFSQDKLNAVQPQLKAAGMRSSYWIGLTRPAPNSNWVFNSTWAPPGTLVWHTPPPASYLCAYFRVDRSGLTAYPCTRTSNALCARDP